MGVFGFDEQFAMFDVTPVENQFILEYMPGARGSFVKVYLYGLMHCYHPQEEMSVQQMSHDLDISEEDVLAAYRHWERKGLVRRVSDNPPSWKYINVKQQFFMRGEAPVDQGYTDFTEALYAMFGSERRLRSNEIAMAYEWVEEMGLPSEVVLMLIQHCIETKGRHFSFNAAQKLAVQLADEQVASVEDAELVFSRDKAVFEGCRRVLRRMGKRRNPSEDEQAMYHKWVREWGYSADAIEAACAETTKGEPTFAYLDGILRGMMRRNQNRGMTSAKEVDMSRTANNERVAPLKALLSILNNGATVNEGTLAVYDEMRAMYPDDVILLAGRECARSGEGLDAVQLMLRSWKQKGLGNISEVQAYVTRFKELNALLQVLYEAWGKRSRPTAADRALAQKWLEQLQMSQEMILDCAAASREAHNPMPYLDRMLTAFAAQGIKTPAEAEQSRAAYQAEKNEKTAVQAASVANRGGKTVREQQYTQREYANTDGLTERMAQRLKELKTNA